MRRKCIQHLHNTCFINRIKEFGPRERNIIYIRLRFRDCSEFPEARKSFQNPIMMKYLLFAILLCPITVLAQFTKGDKFIGGTFDFGTERTPYISGSFSPAKQDQFSVQPQLGYLLSEHLAFGVALGYTHQTFSFGPDTSLSTTISKQYSAGLFLKRYYSIADKFLFSLNGNVNYSKGKVNYSSNLSLDESKTNQILVAVSPSFLFFPSRKWGFEAGIGSLSFTHSKTKGSDTPTNIFDLSYGTIVLGFAYYFQKINITIN
jgi:hypothetical protein